MQPTFLLDLLGLQTDAPLSPVSQVQLASPVPPSLSPSTTLTGKVTVKVEPAPRALSTVLLQEKLDEASDAYDTVELLGGGGADGNLVAALVLLLQGKHEASLARWEHALPGPFRTYGETITLYSMGREAAFSARFQELKDRYGADYPTMVARVYAWMGDTDSAFEWLDRYRVEQPELGPIIGNYWELLSVELKSLHQDPRWHDHLERLGIAPEQLAKFEFDIPLPK